MSTCHFCGSEMIWGGDHSFEDHGIDDEEGIVANLSCSNDKCNATVLAYLSLGAIDVEDKEVELEATGTDG